MTLLRHHPCWRHVQPALHNNPTMDPSAASAKKRPLVEDGSSSGSRSSSSSLEDPFCLFPYYGEHKRAVSAVALAPSAVTPTSPVCASASADGTVKLWNVLPDNHHHQQQQQQQQADPLLTPVTTLLGHSRGINDVAWSPHGGHIATASDDKTLRLWDAQTSDALVEFRGHSNFVFCVRFNPQSNLLVSGSFDETVKLWDVRSGDCVSTLPAHSDPVTGVDMNRDGTCIVSGSHDGLIRIWDTATGECLKTIFAQANPPVSSVRYSPNGQYVLAGTLDAKLRLWKVGAFAKCCKTYAAHANSKYCVASEFLVSNPQRQCIVTGSETGQIYLYNLNGKSNKVHQVLEGGHRDAVLAIACNDKQEYIVSGGMSEDRTVRFWAPRSTSVPFQNNNNKTISAMSASSAPHKKPRKSGGNAAEQTTPRLPMEPPRI